MGRRRTSIFEDIFDMLQQLPWWAGVLAAVAFWMVGRIIFGVLDEDDIRNLGNAVARMIFYGLAILSLLAALVSAIRSVSRRKLLDRQRDIESLRSLPWREFEYLVGEAYRRQGYDVEEAGGGGADGGVDLVLRGHGETVLIQCKQWKARQVGVDKVRELFGVVTAERADRGILVTSGNFTRDAQSFAVGKPLTLVDGTELARLVSEVQKASDKPEPAPEPKETASTPLCPLCASPMILRTARRGAHAGTQFYGCSRYPACKGMVGR